MSLDIVYVILVLFIAWRVYKIYYYHTKKNAKLKSEFPLFFPILLIKFVAAFLSLVVMLFLERTSKSPSDMFWALLLIANGAIFTISFGYSLGNGMVIWRNRRGAWKFPEIYFRETESFRYWQIIVWQFILLVGLFFFAFYLLWRHISG